MPLMCSSSQYEERRTGKALICCHLTIVKFEDCLLFRLEMVKFVTKKDYGSSPVFLQYVGLILMHCTIFTVRSWAAVETDVPYIHFQPKIFPDEVTDGLELIRLLLAKRGPLQVASKNQHSNFCSTGRYFRAKSFVSFVVYFKDILFSDPCAIVRRKSGPCRSNGYCSSMVFE